MRACMTYLVKFKIFIAVADRSMLQIISSESTRNFVTVRVMCRNDDWVRTSYLEPVSLQEQKHVKERDE